MTSTASPCGGRGVKDSVRPVLAAGAGARTRTEGTCRCTGLTSDRNFTANMSDEEQEQTIAEDLVVTKYKMGGDIANRK